MRWGIYDFKGLRHAELDLSPGMITVLTGVNSSGKSSAIQSVLMAAQSQYHDGPVVLNGPLARLGQASDLVRTSSARQSVRAVVHSASGNEELKFSLDLAPHSSDASFEVSQLEICRQTFEASCLRLHKVYSRTADLDIVEDALAEFKVTDLLHLKSVLAPERRPLRTYVGMRGMIPIGLVRVTTADQIVRQYSQAVTTILDDSLAGRSGSPLNRSLPSDFAVGRVIREFVALVEVGINEAPDVVPAALGTLLAARNGNPYRFEGSWRGLTELDRTAAVALAATVRGRTPYIRIPITGRDGARRRPELLGVLELKLRESLEDTVIALGELSRALESVAERVQYLGPLRDEPRVVWSQWNELTRGLPVGTRGEFSAVVLSRSGSKQTEYRLPTGKLVSGSLASAVNAWLAYLDIGQSVSAENLGKLGIGMKVRLEGKERDLTAVGVGVSQALPLVVAVLACPPRSIFIVEQPELHLHPAVQSRLADFLLSARPDLSIVLETHSDALVTRLRRRVAEGEVDASRVNVVFVEGGPEGAVSRSLRISEYGDLSEWPAGFLSDIQEDTTAIVGANMRRLQKARDE